MFVSQEGKAEDFFAVALCVDDLLVVCGNTPAAQTKLATFKEAAPRKFTVTDLGELKWFLGISVHHQPNGNVALDQKSCIESMVAKYKVESHPRVATPLPPGRSVKR